MIDVLSDAGLRQVLDTYKESNIQYEPLQPEQLEVMQGLFPTMQLLHRANRTISGNLPLDHPFYPGQTAILGAYYMNSYDPNTLGKWQLRVLGDDETSSLKAIIDAMPGEVTDFTVGIVADKHFAPATQEDHVKVFSILGPMVGAADRYEPRKRRSAAASLGAFTRKYIGKVAA